MKLDFFGFVWPNQHRNYGMDKQLHPCRRVGCNHLFMPSTVANVNSLMLGHGWVITSHTKSWVWLLIHVLILVSLHVCKEKGPWCLWILIHDYESSVTQSTVSKLCTWFAWCRHQIETFSGVLCEGNPPVASGFPSQRSLTRSFDVFFDVHRNKSWANNQNAGDVRRSGVHCDVTVMRVMVLSCRGLLTPHFIHILLTTAPVLVKQP